MIGNLLYKRAALNDPTKRLKYSPQSTWQYLNCSYFHMLSVNFLGGENKQGQNSGNDIADTQDDNIKSSEVDDPLVCKDPNLVYKRNVFVERHTVRDLSASLWWYSKASHAGSPLGSIYVGLMNHFGIGVPSNRYRASRYYQYALNQSNGESQVSPMCCIIITIMCFIVSTSRI
jgi:TPR repeat protein